MRQRLGIHLATADHHQARAAGARMPFGGPYLDQATIDQIKTWIQAGAPNN